MKSVRFFLLFVVCLALSLAPAASAQENQGDEPPGILKQDPGKRHSWTEGIKRQSRSLLDRLDLLNLSANAERQARGDKIRTVSLSYPQSFFALKPAAHQTAPAKSYFFSLIERDRESTYVALANINTEEKSELKGVYQRELNTELLLGYRWAGFGSILFGHALQLERLGESVSRVNDMGWRIKFVKTF